MEIMVAIGGLLAFACVLMVIGERIEGPVGEKLRVASILCFILGIPIVLIVMGDGGGVDEPLWRGSRGR